MLKKMTPWRLAFAMVAYLNVVYAFTCPEDSHAFYHADVSTGCQVYHFCENSQLQTLTCPSGKAFNHETSKCEDASSVNCYETMDDHSHHHHHRKRSSEVHIVDLDDVHSTLSNAYRSIRPIIERTDPEFRKQFEEFYLPALRKAEKDIMTKIQDRIRDDLEALHVYAFRIIEKFVERAFISYQLTNSTHVAVLPVNDILNEAELEAIAKFGRYVTKYIPKELGNVPSSRLKRDADNDVPDFVYSLAQPFVIDIFKSVTTTFVGDDNSFTSKVLLPTIYEIISDPESRYDVIALTISIKAAYSPLIWELMKQQDYNTPEGTIVRIPRRVFTEANKMFFNDSKPIIYKLLGKHLGGFLQRAASNVPILLDNIKSLDRSASPHSGVMKDAILNFVVKHGKILRSSTYPYMNFYTLTEILNDLRPIKIALFQVMLDYYMQNRDNFFMKYIGEGSLLHKQVLGPPVYAKPKPSYMD